MSENTTPVVPSLIVAEDAVKVGAFAPKPTTITEGQEEAAASVWEEETVDTGVWECTPGTFTATREGFSEICYIISGKATIHTEGSASQELAAGDIFVTPEGWRGSWEIHETIRKHYTIITHS